MDEEPTLPAPHVPPPPDLPPPPAAPPMVEPPVPPRSASVEVSLAAEEVEEVSLAPFNTRVIAALIDLVVALGVQVFALWVLPGFASRAAWLLGAAYLVTRDSLPFLGGQSVGKKAMKLRVVTQDDRPITGNWEAALIRNGVLIIPFFAFIELFILLTREEKPERGLRLGDEWSKTRVIAD